MKNRLFATVLCVLSLWPIASKSLAAWGTSACGPVRATRQGWELHQGVWYFYSAGRQVAGYDPDAKVYRTYDAAKDRWSGPTCFPWETKRCGAGCAVECACLVKGCQCGRKTEVGATDEALQNFGLDCSRIGHRGEVYSINGKEVTAEQAAEAVLAGSADLTDDSAKSRLTIIGTDADRQKVLTDLANHPALAPFKDKLLVWAVEPSHWSINKTGFVSTGSPVIYVQDPQGKTLHRQTDYADGPDALAQALRKISPDYKPEADKDARKSDIRTVDISALLKSPYTLWGVILALGLTLIRRKANQL